MTDSEPVTVAACQLDVPGIRRDPAMLRAVVGEAAGRGAALIVLPELAAGLGVVASYEDAIEHAEPLDGPTATLLGELSALHDCTIVAGLPELDAAGAVYNSAIVVDRGALVHAYRKVHLWGSEQDAFRAGDERPRVVETSAGRVAVMICYDLEFPEWVRIAAEGGAEIVAAPVNWPLREGDDRRRPFEVLKAQAAAVTYRVNVVVADRCGTERGVDWYGGSLVCDADGQLLAGPACRSGGPAAPVVLTATVDRAVARDKSLGPRNDALADRRPELY